ncbi:MAG: MarR family transcriptional regulator [Lentisphaeria bacterium]|nr:MarR family transcriptional regulator [Lentisphaeria bacterium]
MEKKNTIHLSGKKDAASGKELCVTNPVQGPVEVFKKMCRLLETYRHKFLCEDRKHSSGIVSIPQQQYTHLMMIRFALPCNLSKIMEITGLTSAGASLFVNKLVQKEILIRIEDPKDRRNVIISLSPAAKEEIGEIDNRLNRYLCKHFESCTEEELLILQKASLIVCSKLNALPGNKD